jgi:hypothetical protein
MVASHNEQEFSAGCEAARNDVAAGRFVYHWHGHAGHWGHWIVCQLSERFGVEVDGFGLCCVSESDSFAQGYNSIVIAEIDRRHGNGTFQSMFAEAKTQSEESLGEARQIWLERNAKA